MLAFAYAQDDAETTENTETTETTEIEEEEKYMKTSDFVIESPEAVSRSGSDSFSDSVPSEAQGSLNGV